MDVIDEILTAAAKSPRPPSETAGIRVLLIEDDPDQAALAKALLSQPDEGPFEMEWSPNLVAAMNRLALPGIDVAVLDLGMPELAGPRSHRAIRLTAPEIPVVILSADDHIDTKDLTLAAGAEEYLVKGRCSAPELRRAIRRAFRRQLFRAKMLQGRPSERSPGFAVTFLGAKGGVGTTTCLLNITEALSAQHGAIAFETSSQGGFSFQMESPKSPETMRTAALKLDREWLCHSVEPTWSGGGVLFQPLLPWRGSEAAPGMAKKILRLAKLTGDFVLMDAGCQIDSVSTALISESQAVVVVVDCEPASAAAARKTIHLLQPLSRAGCTLKILAVNRSGAINPPTADQLEAYFGVPVLGVVPHLGGPAEWTAEGPARFAVTDPEGPATSSLLEIAWRLSEEAASRQPKKQP
jgi:CheY-like chemotaxis protein/MinD-like ATPase involved in chromosome partitioning or flagellar assembly